MKRNYIVKQQKENEKKEEKKNNKNDKEEKKNWRQAVKSSLKKVSKARAHDNNFWIATLQNYGWYNFVVVSSTNWHIYLF